MAGGGFGIKFAAIMLALGLLIGGGYVGVTKFYQYQQEQEYRNSCLEVINDAIDHQTYYDEISVEGISLGGMTEAEAKEALADKVKELRPEVDIALTYEDQSFRFTSADFTYTDNLDEVLDEAFNYVRNGSEDTLILEYEDLKEHPVNYTLDIELDDSNVESLVKPIALELDQDPTIGSVTFHPLQKKTFTYSGGEDGIEVDEETTCADFRALLEQDEKTGTVEITTNTVKSETDLDTMKEQTVLLSTFSTVSTNTDEGKFNQAKALSLINGTVLEPDETFSFNEVVGNSSIGSDGWKAAATLSGGKVEQNYGGGVCQAATTLYGALMRGNIYVSERHNHQWPSSYVPIGQDATISYGSLDLKFENNTGYTIYLEAEMVDDTLTVNIYGYHPTEWDEIKVTSETTATYEPGDTIYKETDSLPAGTEEVDTTARTGYSAEGQKEFYKDGVLVNTSPIFSSYYEPITGVVLVGTGS